jgi:hypothetical protein
MKTIRRERKEGALSSSGAMHPVAIDAVADGGGEDSIRTRRAFDGTELPSFVRVGRGRCALRQLFAARDTKHVPFLLY